jgi:membrane AbrB-like protein
LLPFGKILLTLLVGCCGGFLALRAKIPAGGIVGAMFAVALFNILTGLALFPWQSKIMTQAIAGAFLAVPLTLDKIKAMRSVLRPAVIVVSGMLFLSIGMGWLCFSVSPMDALTAFFASAPGGMSDIVLISADAGADPLQVSLIHGIKTFFVLGFLPILSRYTADRFERKYPALCALRRDVNDVQKTVQQKSKESGLNLFISILTAVCGGWLGYFSGIPAGALIFGMVFICILNFTTNRAYVPLKIRRFAQMCAGSMIGSNITMDNVKGIPVVLLPLIIILAGNVVINLGFGMVVFFLSKLDIHSALFSTIPAGVADMALMADEMEGDGPKVALIQTFRLASTVAIFPQVYFWIVRTFL